MGRGVVSMACPRLGQHALYPNHLHPIRNRREAGALEKRLSEKMDIEDVDKAMEELAEIRQGKRLAGTNSPAKPSPLAKRPSRLAEVVRQTSVGCGASYSAQGPEGPILCLTGPLFCIVWWSLMRPKPSNPAVYDTALFLTC